MALHLTIIPVTPYEQNCTLLWDDESNDAVLTDVGGNAPEIWQYIQDNHLNLKEIWLTHGHLDHVGGVVKMCELIDVPVMGPHEDDLFLLEDLANKTREYAKYGFEFSPNFLPTRWLQEGEQLKLGNYVFDVLHIPGHTPGHVVFYCASEKLLIAGDTLFKESVGRTDFPRSNTQDLLNAIRTKLYVLPDDVVVIPGHRDTTTIGHEKQHNPHVRA
ncbi:MBL fold metallo-hydrolase [Alysiella crassa]|uniref:Hydroxyacylglutathione hydrolase n=1 Tax=Alysiella crassa TaxID=153491 RepID=A0A376BKN5_9NEIS|nr:MBL fold metallo-hydrolase [Alysiella crassa]SSY70185.1 hydroxyacylglutathione hydrolase [Alysiella crassa]